MESAVGRRTYKPTLIPQLLKYFKDYKGYFLFSAGIITGFLAAYAITFFAS